MSLFGFYSKKEVEEKESSAKEWGKANTLYEQQTSLANIAKGSQLKFAIPFFDVFDPRFENFAVPVTVHGTVLFAIDDIATFNEVNKAETFTEDVFRDKLLAQLKKNIIAVVANAPACNNMPVLQLERKIAELSELVQNNVSPNIERLMGVNIRSIDITSIKIDKTSRGYRELNAIVTDLEKETIQTRSDLNIDAMKRRQELDLGGQEELQRMQLEHQRESMRIQREELQRASRLQTETNFLSAHQANLNAAMHTAQTGNATSPQMQAPPMPGMGGGIPPMPGAIPQVSYMVGVNGQQAGPFNWAQLQQLVQQGQLTHNTYVWKQGMPQWALAGQVQELLPLFATTAPPMPGMPPMM